MLAPTLARIFAFVLLAPAAASTPPAASSVEAAPARPQDARTLLAAMARLQGLEARFTETKTIALLKAPLVSHGVLYYLAPGHLVRVVETPSPSTVRIGPERLEVRDASGAQQFDLRARPDIKTFVESFVHVMAGHHDALAATYTLEFVPAPADDAPWTLVLTPKRAPLSELVTRLEVTGRGYEIATIRVLERKGDRTEIRVTAVGASRTFSAAEKRSLFGLAQ